MKRINKLINNLKRLNFKNICIVLLYLVKSYLKIKPTKKEIELYFYYSNLVLFDGYLIQETKKNYIAYFKNSIEKKIKLRKNPSSDIAVFGQIYKHKEYQPVIEIYNKNFRNISTYKMNIIDAGANIGLTALYFSDYFKNANIICIEPEKNNFDILNYNLTHVNDCNVVTINAGIWVTNTKLKIVNDFRDKSDWAYRVEETQDNNGIQAYTINYIVKSNNIEYIDILKIDVEGSEKEIFTLSNSNLDFLKITKCIAIEIHDEFNCRADIYKVLTNYGFAYFEEGQSTIGINNNLITL